MRPIKTRFINDIQVEPNLYPDSRKRPGYYRYKKPDGKYKTFQAPSVEDANTLVREADQLAEQGQPVADTADNATLKAILKYIEYQEKHDPSLTSKRSWENRKYAMKQFADRFDILGVLTYNIILDWWDELTHAQQKMRRAAFRSMFNWFMGQGYCPRLKYNPFTTADDRPKLNTKPKPTKSRSPVTTEIYDAMLPKADQHGFACLRIAMEISSYTTLREGDICKLRFDKNIIEGELRVIVSKSEAQKGTARAARLRWVLDKHPDLKALINEARELAMMNNACPFIISHRPKRRVWNQDKVHICQVTGDRLSRMFKEVMEACDFSNTCFHEVRGYAATRLRAKGFTNEQIQELMAHESIYTTIGYQDADALPYDEIVIG